MKKYIVVILLSLIVTGCANKKAQLTKIESTDAEYREIEEFLDNNKNINSGLIVGKNKYILIYDNPNIKVTNIGLNIINGYMNIDIDGEKSKNEPISFYNIEIDDKYNKSDGEFSVSKHLTLEENGKEINPVIFDGVNIFQKLELTKKNNKSSSIR